MTEPDDKHLQLGVDLDNPALIDRTEISDAAKDALWADAVTVEEFAAGLDALRGEHPLVLWELARARQEGG